MRNKIYRSLLLLFGLFAAGQVIYAQNNEEVKGVMRSNGKIYVVLAICITILAGFFLYLVSIDRKIGRAEDKQ